MNKLNVLTFLPPVCADDWEPVDLGKTLHELAIMMTEIESD